MSVVSALFWHADGTGGLFVPNCRHGRVLAHLAQFTLLWATAQGGFYACRLLYLAAVQDGGHYVLRYGAGR